MCTRPSMALFIQEFRRTRFQVVLTLCCCEMGCICVCMYMCVSTHSHSGCAVVSESCFLVLVVCPVCRRFHWRPCASTSASVRKSAVCVLDSPSGCCDVFACTQLALQFALLTYIGTRDGPGGLLQVGTFIFTL